MGKEEEGHQLRSEAGAGGQIRSAAPLDFEQSATLLNVSASNPAEAYFQIDPSRAKLSAGVFQINMDRGGDVPVSQWQ